MSHVLETGEIHFYYEEKMAGKGEHGDGVPAADASESLPTIGRFFLVLQPQEGKFFRRVGMGQTHLPDPAGSDGLKPIWGFVENGQAHGALPASHVAGKGHYVLSAHEDHAHLAFKLNERLASAAVCEALHLREEGNYLISVKNPSLACPPGSGLPREMKAKFPGHLQKKFGERRFIALSKSEYLDYIGAEFLLFGAEEKFPESWPSEESARSY